MTIERRHIQLFFIHFFLWALFYGFFLFPFFFQLRQVPPNLPVRLVLTVVLFYFNYFLICNNLLAIRWLLVNKTEGRASRAPTPFLPGAVLIINMRFYVIVQLVYNRYAFFGVTVASGDSARCNSHTTNVAASGMYFFV